MKHITPSILFLASVSNAIPMAQLNWPGFSWSGFPARTSAVAVPVPTNIGTTPSSIHSTPTVDVQPTSTAGSGNVGSNCTPQGNSGRSSENGVKDKNCCTEVTVIYARGTGEIGNVGSVSGPPMFKALRQKLGADRVTVQGVDYAASADGISSGGGTGGAQMASDVQAALQQCPQTKVIVSGYSQGAMVVHNAFSAQSLSASQVVGAVLFGDPQIRQSVGDLPAAKVKQFCGSSDNVCRQPSGNVNGGHLSCGSVSDAAADFIIEVAGLS